MLRYSFGKRLKFLRQIKKTNQESLAAAIGVSKQHIGRIERGISSPSFEVLERLCQVLETAPASMFLSPECIDPGAARQAKEPRADSCSHLIQLDAGIWSMDRENNEQYWSSALHRLLGYSREQRPTKELFLSHVHEHDREAFEHFHGKVMAGSLPASLVLRIRRKDGLQRSLRVQADMLRGHGSEALRASITFQDVTELQELREHLLLNQEQLETAIQEKTRSLAATIDQKNQEIERRIEAEKRARVYQKMVEASADPISFVSYDYTYLAANRQAASIWGTSPEAMLGRKVGEVTGEELFQEVIKPRLDAALAGEVLRAQSWINHEEGSRRFLDVTYSPHREDGRVVGVVAMARDLTQHELLCKELAASRQAMDASLAAKAICTDKRVLTYVNESFCRLWGLSSPQDAMGLHAFDFWESAQEVAEVFEVLANNTSWEGWLQGRRQDGSTFTARVLASPLLDDKENLTGFTASFWDETERLALEKELADSEAKTRALLNATTDGVVLLDCEGRIVDLNEEYARRFAASREQLLGTLVWELFSEEVAAHRKREVAAAFASGTSARFIDSRNGFWNDYVISPIQDAAGNVLQVAVFAHDITELMQDKHALAKSEKKLQAFLQALPECAMLLDTDGVVLKANDVVAQRHQKPLGEIIGRCISEIMPPEVGSTHSKQVKTVLATGEPLDYSVQLHGRDIETRLAPIRGQNDGDVRGVAMLGFDVTSHNQAREELLQSKLLLEMALEAGSLATWEMLPEEGKFYAGAALRKLVGYDLTDLSDNLDDWKELVPPSYRPPLDAMVEAFLNGEKDAYQVEHPYKRKDGSIGWVHVEGSLVRDSKSDRRRLVGVCKDITLRKQEEEALRNRETLYRGVVEDQAELICRYLPDGRLSFVNEAYARYYGMTRQELLDTNFIPEILADDLEMVLEQTSALSAANPQTFFEHRILRPHGEVRWQQWTHRAIFDHAGNIIEYQAVGRDVTDFKQSEERLRESEERFRLLASTIQDVFWMSTPGFTQMLYVSPGCEKLWGRSVSSLYAEPLSFLDAVHPDDRPKVEHGLQSHAQGSWHFVYRIVRPDGSVRWINDQGYPHYDAQGNLHFLAGLATDITERKQVEEYLSDSLTWLRTIMQTSPAGITLINASGIIHYANARAEAILGLEASAIKTRTYKDPAWRITAADGEEFPEDNLPFTIVRETLQPVYAVEHAIEWPNGRRILLSINAAPLFDGKDEFSGAVCSLEDITYRREIERKILLSEQRYRTLFQKSAEGILVVDLQGTVLEANLAALEMFGYTLEEMTRLHPYQLVHPDEALALQQEFASIVREDFVAAEHRCHHKNGEEIIVIMKGKLVDASLVQVVLQDITVQRRQEEQLRLLNRAVEQSQVAVVITNTDGMALYVNQHFTAMTGYTPLEALGQNHLQPASSSPQDTPLEDIRSTLQQGQVWKGEFRGRRKNGEEYWEYSVISPVLDRDGAITHYVVVKQDMTQRKKLEQQKEDVERMIRHDLKTPLNGIVGVPQLLLQDDNLTQDQRGYLRHIYDSGQRMLDMINLSLVLFKIEQKEYTVTPKPYSMEDVLQQVVTDLGKAAADNPVSVDFLNEHHLEAPAGTLHVLGESLLAYSLLSNLLRNAVEASPKGESVHVLMQNHDGVTVAIHNKGAVPPGLRERFFDKYATQGKKVGTGLGTYSAKLLAEAMGYDLRMETSDQENSTRLVLTIPPTCVDHDPKQCSKRKSTQDRGERRKWLRVFVEDLSAATRDAPDALFDVLNVSEKGVCIYVGRENLNCDTLALDIHTPTGKSIHCLQFRVAWHENGFMGLEVLDLREDLARLLGLGSLVTISGQLRTPTSA